MDLNFIFNQHLKTIGLFLKKMPDDEFKTLKYLTRQLQDSIAEQLSSKIYFTNDLEPDSLEEWTNNSVQSVRDFVSSTLSGGKNEQTK